MNFSDILLQYTRLARSEDELAWKSQEKSMSNTSIAPETAAAEGTSTVAAAAPAQAGRPASSYGTAPHDPSKPPVKRQIVCFSFYKVMPEWRRLPAEEKAAHKAAFAEVLVKWNKPGEFLSLTYSTIGTRGDVDMCIWSIR